MDASDHLICPSVQLQKLQVEREKVALDESLSVFLVPPT